MINRTKLTLFMVICSGFCPEAAVAQLDPALLWNDVRESSFATGQERQIIPAHYRALALNMGALFVILDGAPMEGTLTVPTSRVIVSLPLPGGDFERFRIVESPIMAPALAVRYREIRTYMGQGVDDATASVRFDVTPAGFHAMILSAEHTVYIDPYSRGNTRNYISYFKQDLVLDASRHFEENGIEDPDGEMAAEISRLVASGKGPHSIGEQLRTYRLALAGTGEYTAYHGGTVPAGLAAMVVAMNRVNGIYEREVAVRMVLVANNDQLVYINPATDPYTNNNGSTMLGQNQTNLDNVIGSANYDIGHVFSTGGGGVAGLGVVCRSAQKARGVTGSSAPIGDGFYVDYVAHEMGHQFGGNHSFNSVTSNCGGGNRNASTAYEPGSGTTVMAYAGICGADDIQPHSDDYFHVISIDEIVAYTTGGSGNSCPVVTSTGNSAPTVSVGAGGATIPQGTSFFMTGSAFDPDGDTLTYCWEEFDLGPAGSPNTPSGNAPIFRSFKGTRNPTRTFPRLSDILNNTHTIGEILPSYTRSLSFRLIARDNRAGGGGVGRSSSITIGVNGTAGPFAVNSPASWLINSTDTVRWSVANTNTPPINCASVNILLSTDGGQSFPMTLAASTPNDGAEAIAVPNVSTQAARVKVEAVGNIFFDISNANFSIGIVQAPTLISPPDSATNLPNSVTLLWRSVPSATMYHVQVSSIPTFATMIINDSTMTDTSRSVTGLGFNSMYYWRVRGRNGNEASGWTAARNFRTAAALPGTPTLTAPPNNATNQPSTLALQWGVVIGATSFHVQVSLDSLFATTIVNDSAVITTQRSVTVSTGTRYYWHVRARNAGGSGAFSATWNFTTTLTSVIDRSGLPNEFALSQNYPNPFNPATVIEFALARESFVTLEIYNPLGELVALLVEGKRPAGYYSEPFNALGLASGLYYCRLKAGEFVQTRKLLLLK